MAEGAPTISDASRRNDSCQDVISVRTLKHHAPGTSAISQPCGRSGRHYQQALYADLVGLAYGPTRLELRVSRGYETWGPLRGPPR